MEPKIGLQKSACHEIANELRNILADTYALYLKTQNYHWNVIAPHFSALHLMFEKQYEELAEAVDELAERIRSLGGFVDGTFADFSKRTQIKDTKPNLDWKKMVQELLKGHEEICRRARPLIHRAQDHLDDITADLVIRRMAFHEKAAWMLRSSI